MTNNDGFMIRQGEKMGARLSVIALVLLTFVSFVQAKPFSYNPDRTERLQPGQKLQFLTWNVHKYAEYQTSQFLTQLSKKKDIFAIQESMMEGVYQSFYEKLSDQQWFSAASFRTNEGFLTGVTTGSRYIVDKVISIRSKVLEPVVSTPKMIILTYLPIGDTGQELLVANIHGINFVSTEDFAVQIGQLEEALVQHQGPIILAGDFNTYTVGRALTLGQMARRLGLNYLWPKHDSRTMRLDHVFVRGVAAGDARVRFDLNSSDHFPIEVEVTLPR